MSRQPHILIFAFAMILGAATFAAEDAALADTNTVINSNAPPPDPTNTPAAVSAANDPVTAAVGPSTGNTFESFRIISDRNIFNQNRSARSARRDSSRPKAAPVVQSLSLVGTMTYEKGDFAFFDGTSPDYKKGVKPGEKIAGYEVKEINPTCVKIANDKQQFEMKVGQQLRREDEGEWQLASGSSRSATPSASAESKGSGESATSSSGSASEDEALKRLMEKRAKEIN
jgi:hypothetical protein